MNIDNLNLRTKERVYAGLGLLLMAISLILALIGYIVWPLFTGKSWVIANPVLHASSAAAGCVMSWLGLGRLIDHTLKHNLGYKVARWLISKTLSLAGSAIALVVFLLSGETPRSSRSITDQTESNTDDIWKSSPDHYYDNEPPPPFS